MYKAVIVDDEYLIRRGIKKFIEKKANNFEVVGVYTDGGDAISHLKEHKVDLIITDIRMINYSGLDVARFIYENNLNTIIVILSGYKDFEYAKQAMSYGAQYYLLKPTDFTELAKVLYDVEIKLEKIYEQNHSHRHYQEILPIIREEFFTDLYMGTIQNIEQLKMRSNYAGINEEEGKFFYLIDVRLKNEDGTPSNWQYGKDKLLNLMKNLMMEFSAELYKLSGKENSFIAVCISKTPIENIISQINKELSIHIKVEIQCLKKYKHLSDFISDNKDYCDLEEICRLLLSHISLGNISEASTLLSNALKCIPKGIKRKEALDKINAELLEHCGIQLDSDDEKSAESRFEQAALQHIKDNTENVVINKAKEFVKQNFSEDISLEDVAEHVYFNTAYFSRIFKQSTGQNFTDYLTEIRMKKAIEMMKKTKQIGNVFGYVGYKNSRYFGRVFKKHTGYTPLEYMRFVIKAEEK